MAARSDQILTGANNFDNNNHYNSVIREHMFDKVVTPSDVGKLNRLVIPKQHAENYFPLDDNQNGTVLDFQDRNGKMWRFRYSYWNSSQSYVMTKGWSRFVKDKKLDAGDTVSFHRGYVADDNEPERRRKVMFIDWRHRAEMNLMQHNLNIPYPIFQSFSTDSYYPMMPEYSMSLYRGFLPEVIGVGFGKVTNGGGRYYTADVRNLTSEVRRPSPLDHHHQRNLGRSEPLVLDSYPVFPAARMNPSPPQMSDGASTVKKLRLFGVDVEESSSSEKTRGEMGFGGTSSSPVVIRDDDGQYWRSPRGEMGASSSSWVMQLSDEEEYKRKGKSIYNK